MKIKETPVQLFEIGNYYAVGAGGDYYVVKVVALDLLNGHIIGISQYIKKRQRLDKQAFEQEATRCMFNFFNGLIFYEVK